MSSPTQLQSARIPPRQRLHLVDVLKAAKRATEMGLEVSFPCTVVAFDSTEMKVDIQEDILHDRYTGDGTATVDALVLKGVRIQHEGQGRTGGGYLTWPIAVGDKGRFAIQDRYIGTWGIAGTRAIPTLKHTHNRPDGFFIPGIRDDSRKIPKFDAVAAVLESTLIKLGANATEAAALGTTLKAYTDAFNAWASTHTHAFTGTIAIPAGTCAGNTVAPLPTPPTVPNFLSTKVSVE